MPAPKRIPVEVLERARAVSKDKRAVSAPAPSAPRAKATLQPKSPREKVVAALKRLHPMD